MTAGIQEAIGLQPVGNFPVVIGIPDQQNLTRGKIDFLEMLTRNFCLSARLYVRNALHLIEITWQPEFTHEMPKVRGLRCREDGLADSRALEGLKSFQRVRLQIA